MIELARINQVRLFFQIPIYKKGSTQFYKKFSDIRFFLDKIELVGSEKEQFINAVFSIQSKLDKAWFMLKNGTFVSFLLAKFIIKDENYIIQLNKKMQIDLVNRYFCRFGFPTTEYITILVHEVKIHLPLYDCDAFSFFVYELPGYIAKKNINNGDVVLDVGAYHGWFSIYASQKTGKFGKIIAFEPNESNICFMQQMLKLNNITNVFIVPKGIWDKTALISFLEDGGTSMISSEGNVTIPVVALDEELPKLSLSYTQIDFIKMDIEGAEIEALAGMKKLLKQGTPAIAIATYHKRGGERTCKKVEDILKSYNFDVITDYPEHLTTYGEKDNEEKITTF